ncbi:MAG: hypothetical protein H6811_06420 [Phycisphaeraceae bacterium]|nr:hypothetical protein [Phycisphaeraceae bacterium]
MNPKSGKAGSAITPTEPTEALEADNADPGEIAELKASQAEAQAGKYGEAKVEPYKPMSEEEQDDADELTWIEIRLTDSGGRPAAGQRYEIELPDGRIDTGSLDQHGLARLENIVPGECGISFPELDEDDWEPK